MPIIPLYMLKRVLQYLINENKRKNVMMKLKDLKK
jgi:hypothetical protein